MPAGRPRRVDPGTLYAFAHQFYWDFLWLSQGRYRWRTDDKQYDRLISESENVQLSDEQKSHLIQYVEEEVRAGRWKETEKEARLRDLEGAQLAETREWVRWRAADEARKQLRVPGEPHVLKALLHPRISPERVRRICKDACVPREVEVEPGRTRSIVMPNWPISAGSTLPSYLSQYATEFIAAMKDRRYPGSGRPSNHLKQLWFLSRALAGAIFGVKTRTAINLVGSKRPDQIFDESRAGKPVRRKRRKK